MVDSMPQYFKIPLLYFSNHFLFIVTLIRQYSYLLTATTSIIQLHNYLTFIFSKS